MIYNKVQNIDVKKKASLKLLCTALLACLLFVTHDARAQNYSNAHDLIKTLSSDSLYGRGYQHQADKKAANIISEAFSSLRYQSLQQPVRFNLNEFSTTPELRINNLSLKLAEDFLPAANSPSFTIELNKNNISASFSRDSSEIYVHEQNDTTKRLIIRKRSSLTHSLSTKQSSEPVVFLREQAWPDSTTSLRYAVSTQVRDITSFNVIMFADSTRPYTHLFMAHYDHLGTIGTKIFNGANDNASGVGMMLQLADTLRNYSPDINPLFVAFTAEEAGLIGSRYFHHFYKDWWDDVSVVLNFDMVASGDGEVGLVGAVESEQLYEHMEQMAKPDNFYLKPRPNSPISDHYWFIDSGLSGFYIYTGNGNQPYHHPDDDFASLDLTLFDQMAEFLTNFTINSANN